MGKLIFLLLFIIFPLMTVAKDNHQHHHSSYAGEETRIIKSLSADDVDQLKNGKGWGFAKAAELNGMPGPLHVLEMKNEISLTEIQEKKISALYKKMKEEAISLGEKYVNLEKALNDSFAQKKISEKSLEKQLKEIANVRSSLRFIHLKAHLATPNILTEHQIKKYNKLRGYGVTDPCDHVPAGHNAEMWKKHNGCK